MSIQRRGILYQVQTIISAAQVRAWNTTPITIAPAPGVNRMIQGVSLAVQYKFGTYPFGTVDPNNLFTSYLAYLDVTHVTTQAALFAATSSTLVMQTADYVEQGVAHTLLTRDAGLPTGSTIADVVNKPLLLAGQADLQGGRIATSTLNAGGTGYAVNDTGTIDPSNNGSATYKVLTLGASDAVATYQITAPGNGYVVASGLETDSSGIGTGFKVNVTGINKGDGQLITTVLYAVVPLV